VPVHFSERATRFEDERRLIRRGIALIDSPVAFVIATRSTPIPDR